MLRYFYPPHCFACSALLEPQKKIFCAQCYQNLEFSPLHPEPLGAFESLAFLFVRNSVSEMYWKAFNQGAFYLEKGLSGFIILRLLDYAWPLEGVLCPTTWILRNYSPFNLLAKRVASLLELPLWFLDTRPQEAKKALILMKNRFEAAQKGSLILRYPLELWGLSIFD